jgi:hypothetical protein
MEDNFVSLIDEIRGRLMLIESNLPKRVDAMAVSAESKLPFKVLLYREALIWRIAELGRAALENFEKDKLVTAIVMTRAAVETSAALWYLCNKVSKSVELAEVGDIDVYLMRLIAGVATGAPITNEGGEDLVMPRPIRVREFLKQVDSDIEGFSHQYGILSEYAHPNWAGTVYLYARHDQINLSTDFGQNIGDARAAKSIGISNLGIALVMFERSYNLVADLIPEFTRLCEERFRKNK